MISQSGVLGRNPGMRFLAMTLLAFSLLIPGTALADPDSQNPALNPMLRDKWSIWLGGFFPSLNTDIRFDSDQGSPGDGLSLEDTLGLDDSKSVLWGGVRWRISRRNQIEFEFANLDRTGQSGFITDELNIGEQKIQAGGAIDTKVDFALGRITYGFAVLQREKHELAVKGGFHMTRVNASLQLFGDITDVDTGQTLCAPSPCQSEQEETDAITLPLPHFGLSYAYAFTPKWALRTQLLGFAIKVNDIQGILIEADLDLQYQPWKHFGFGGGLRSFTLKVEDEGLGGGLVRGKIEYRYWGPVIYFLGTF